LRSALDVDDGEAATPDSRVLPQPQLLGVGPAATHRVGHRAQYVRLGAEVAAVVDPTRDPAHLVFRPSPVGCWSVRMLVVAVSRKSAVSSGLVMSGE
jgi:hypothetical protein